ncbi:hypothetical protein BGZ83_000289 [Gryganskiella cystojenkinii]|nr:hypothetical protein BGZ83_000289 [Gryganskiella cystojenkinii]
MDTTVTSSDIQDLSTTVDMSTVPIDHEFGDPDADKDMESLNAAADDDLEENVFEIHLAAATKTTKDLLHAKNTTRN